MFDLNLLSITMRNFYSVGNVTECIVFENGKMSLVLGDNVDYGENIRNGVGKAQPHTAKIKIPNGWTSMGDIKVGDIVCTPDGHNVPVIGKFPQGKRKIYKIILSDNTQTEACAEHLWEVIIDGKREVLSTIEIKNKIAANQRVSLPTIEYTLEKTIDYDMGKSIEDFNLLKEISAVSRDNKPLMSLYDDIICNSHEVRSMFLQKLDDMFDLTRLNLSLAQAYFLNELALSIGAESSIKKAGYFMAKQNSFEKNNETYYCVISFDDNGLKRISSVVDTEREEEVSCIKIASERELYITDDYIVTHNTTMMNAISYALFGQPITKSKQDSMVNYLNKKNMLVRLDFKIGDVNYYIERGRKPKVLRFVEIKDGDEKDIIKSLGENADTDREIQRIIGMSFALAKYIMLMSTYTVPFMNASAADQRQVIEELIKITELSEKASKIAEKEKHLKGEIEKEKVRLATIQDSNIKIQRTIDSLQRSIKNWYIERDEDLKRLRDNLDVLNQINIQEELVAHEHNLVQDQIMNKRKLLENEIKHYTALTDSNLAQMLNLSKKLDEADHTDTCPTCKQDVKAEDLEDYKQTLLTEAQTKLQESDAAESKTAKLKMELDNITVEPKKKTVYDDVRDALEHENRIKSMEERITMLENDTNPFEKQLTEMDSLVLEDVDFSNCDSMEKELDHYKFMKKLLSDRDSFIRKDIIKKNIPYLNQRLQYHLPRLSLPHVVTFDPNLTFNIIYMGIEVEYNNLSRGEQNRLTFALNLAFRDVYEKNTGSINAIFVDELLDFGIDTKGARDGLYMLKEYSRDMDKATYLVTHKDELIESADSIIYVRKENDFTTYEVREQDT